MWKLFLSLIPGSNQMEILQLLNEIMETMQPPACQITILGGIAFKNASSTTDLSAASKLEFNSLAYISKELIYLATHYMAIL